MNKFGKIAVIVIVLLCLFQIVHYFAVQYEKSFYLYTSYYAKTSIGKGFNSTWKSYFSATKLKEFEKELDMRLKLASTQKINILMWEPSPGNVELWSPDRDQCGYCEVSCNKSLAEHPATKAIVFHYAELSWTTLPRHRRSDQFYVWLSMEPPSMLTPYLPSIRKYDNIFNLTFSYRLDADIWRPYNVLNVLKRDMENSAQKIDDLMKRKRKLALWVVSNCNGSLSAIERMQFAKSLFSDGLDVDFVGKCFPGGRKNVNFGEYKFYLSLENSIHCKDYITEKFFNNALLAGTVPVVLGAKKEDYDLVAPRNSYIYAKDYSNKELVDLLNYLDRNDTAYKEYFKWREHPVVIPSTALKNRARDVCQLCRYLHGINVDNLFSRNYNGSLKSFTAFSGVPIAKTVPSLMKWLFSEENERCVADFYKFNSNLREKS